MCPSDHRPSFLGLPDMISATSATCSCSVPSSSVLWSVSHRLCGETSEWQYCCALTVILQVAVYHTASTARHSDLPQMLALHWHISRIHDKCSTRVWNCLWPSRVRTWVGGGEDLWRNTRSEDLSARGFLSPVASKIHTCYYTMQSIFSGFFSVSFFI